LNRRGAAYLLSSVVALAVLLFAGYRLAGSVLPAAGGAAGVFPSWLPPLVDVAVVALLCAGLALAVRWATRRSFGEALIDLARQVTALRENPSPRGLSEPAGGEEQALFRDLQAAIDVLSTCYRQALSELVVVHEAMETMRATQERANAEKGFTYSFIQRRKAGWGGYSRRMVCRLAPNFHWMAATPALQQYLARGLADLNARSFLETVHPDDREAMRGALEDALKNGEGHNITCRLLIGPLAGAAAASGGAAVKHVQMDVQSRYTDEGTPLHLRCHFLDISERVRTEQELHRHSAELADANQHLRQVNADLQRLKEGYRDLYHQAPVMYFSLDPRGHFAACNETMMQTLGYSREDLFGQPYTRLLPPAAVSGGVVSGEESGGEDHSPRTTEFWKEADEIETQWVKKDGTVIDVWIRTTPVFIQEGNRQRFSRSRSTAQDVTERKRLFRELEQANEQLRRINSELDQFTHAVSHDLKEPLRTLEAFSNFLAEDYGGRLGREGGDYIRHLVNASRRLGHLIDNLLALSRAGRVIGTPRPFFLEEIVGTVCEDLADLIQRKAAVVRVAGPLPVVVGDAARVTQLLSNLIGNALKYNNSSRPEVVVGTTARKNGGPRKGVGPSPGAENSALVTCYVRDNGIGIDPRHHEQIFRLFRRLHRQEDYEGTGAGLTICKKIVEAHGGQIWVESELDQGAAFFFTLLALPPPAAAPKPARGGAAVPPADVLAPNSQTQRITEYDQRTVEELNLPEGG
jgi:PAS domain S-box-containing protein